MHARPDAMGPETHAPSVLKGHRMKHSHLAAATLLTAALALGATGCASDQAEPENETPAETVTEDAPAEEEPAVKTPIQRAGTAYHAATASASVFFDLEEDLAASATYSYAFVNMNGDEIPQLLLKASGDPAVWNGIEIVRVVLYDAENDKLLEPARDIQIGVAGAGGYRGSLAYSAYGDGLLHSEFSAGTGEGEVKRITTDGHRLDETFVAPISIGCETAESTRLDEESREIVWLDVNDPSAIDTLKAGEWQTTAVAEAPAAPAAPAAPEASDAAAASHAAGLEVHAGTLRILDAQGVCDLQGQQLPYPGASDGSTYVVLDLGGEQQVTARPGDGSPGVYTNSARLLLLEHSPQGASSTWSGKDGARIAVSIDPEMSYWPSDVSVPVGQPNCTRSAAIVG